MATSLSTATRKSRLIWLGILLTPLVASSVLRLGGMPCPFLWLTGIPCPGCGLTRSFLALGRHDFSGAIAHHLFGPLLFIALGIALGHLTLELCLNRQINTIYTRAIQSPVVVLAALASLWAYHGHRLYHLFSTGELTYSFLHSPLGQTLF